MFDKATIYPINLHVLNFNLLFLRIKFVLILDDTISSTQNDFLDSVYMAVLKDKLESVQHNFNGVGFSLQQSYE